MKLSPVALIVLLECHYKAEMSTRNMNIAQKEAVSRFVAEDLIARDNGEGTNIEITDKGRFYVEHLCSIPFPVQVNTFAIPDEKQT